MSIFNKVKEQGYYVIGEIGVNYYDIAKKENISPISAAKLMIDKAKQSGMDAVKFQSYKAETIASKNSPSYWDTEEESTTSQYELFKKFDSFSFKEYEELSNYCKEKEIEFFSTAFDYESADYLEDLMDIYKISSSDLTNLPFIEYQAKKQKTIIISTGASNLDEIHAAIKTIEKTGNNKIIIMHCVLEYPTPYQHANLNVIKTLQEEFSEYIIGYSDHTKPDKNMDVVTTAVSLGAIVIEKHYTLDKSIPGNDHYHAMDPNDMVKLKERLDFQQKILGSKEINLDSQEAARKNARRSIVINQNLDAGTILKREMLEFKRPGTGISPSEVENIVGKELILELNEDSILTFDMIK